jgi:hypothetical protein
MAQDIINFGPDQNSSNDDLGGSSPYAINIYKDEKGVIYKRPGIKVYTGVAPAGVIDATGISGLYSTNDGQLFAVNNQVNSRTIYKVANGSATQVNGLGDDKLIGNSRPVFTETEVYLIIAGAWIFKSPLTTLQAIDWEATA